MVNGIILLDKPKDRTSRDMVNELNHIFDMKKIGHTGTLDPLATGMLILCLGKYTKLVDLLQDTRKEYVATVKLGIKTDTLDITGNVCEEAKCEVSKQELIKVLKSMKGEVEQEIPKYSAKKINGKKLYEYARENIEIDLPKNTIEIYSIDLIECNNDEFIFKAEVSKGTYIRSIIQIICNKLGVIGTMKDLRRTKEWHYDVEKDANSLEQIRSGKYKLYYARDFLPYKIYNLNEEEYQKVKNGAKICINETSDNIILIYNDSEVAIYVKDDIYYKPSIMLI